MTSRIEEPTLRPIRHFPSDVRRYARLPIQSIQEGLACLLTEAGQMETPSSYAGGEVAIRGRIGGILGVKVEALISPENGMTRVDVGFNYKRLLLAYAGILSIGLCLGWVVYIMTYSEIAGYILAAALIFMIFSASSRLSSQIRDFLMNLDETLAHLEHEHAKEALAEDRKRWQSKRCEVENLYMRLCSKHLKTWGSLRVLEYKISEYERQGLTREEAIVRVSEEEGIY
ncbi:MAG: hypothetical protein RMJ07_00635 [Nitrososphaerota archaeon]|nr:hypothetical protein [Candidatus Bathyarchaeota archaeon]MDW8048179.1 hypothetical protein [Nitrososphaerota archaeon]